MISLILRPTLLLICSLSLLAQVDHSSLSGTVTDSTGALVPNAKIETLSDQTGLRRQTVSGSAGTYQIPGLPIGTYTIKVTKEGFKPLEIKNVELAVGQPRTI